MIATVTSNAILVMVLVWLSCATHRNAMQCNVLQCYAMLCIAGQCNLMQQNDMLWSALLFHATTRHGMPCYIMLRAIKSAWHSMPCNVMPLQVMSCPVMSCCVMPRSVMAHYETSCRVTLSYVRVRHTTSGFCIHSYVAVCIHIHVYALVCTHHCVQTEIEHILYYSIL